MLFIRFNHYFFTRKYNDITLYIPSVDYAKHFSIESIFNIESFGVHKPWKYLNKEDYNLQSNNNVSCLCTFQLNNYGEILKDTFAIPEYFISIACLNKKHSYPKTWLDLVPKIQQKVEDTYKNWVDVLSNRPNCTVKFEDLKALLTDIINASEVSDFHNLIRNNAIIYSSCIPVPNRFKDDKEKGEEKGRKTGRI